MPLLARFLSTPSARRATETLKHPGVHGIISIHALREEGDLHPDQRKGQVRSISIHALREEGDIALAVHCSDGSTISIHALREEGDRPTFCSNWASTRFLSTPSARRATTDTAFIEVDYLFLSTPSARRATHQGRKEIMANQFLSTPSARRATHPNRLLRVVAIISIHALREEGDDLQNRPLTNTIRISIHALREEGDRLIPRLRRRVLNFYPRPPRGGRRGSLLATIRPG